jgi:endonuclease G
MLKSFSNFAYSIYTIFIMKYLRIIFILSLFITLSCKNRIAGPIFVPIEKSEASQEHDIHDSELLPVHESALDDTVVSFCAYDSLNIVVMDACNDNVDLERSSYLISYNTATRCPDYVSWKIDRNRLDKNVERTDWFVADEDVSEVHRIKHSDYSRSGYDRGHMCPAADNRYDSLAMVECFLMTNMCPQTHRLNAGDWNDLEDLCRKWGQRYDAVYVVCGPLFSADKTHKIGARKKYKISVPERFFKVVVVEEGGDYMGVGFVMNNNDSSMPLEKYVVSIDYVENLTGFDFFSAMPDVKEKIIESNDKFIEE